MVVSDIDVPQRLLYGIEKERVAVAQVEHTTVSMTVEPTHLVVQVIRRDLRPAAAASM